MAFCRFCGKQIPEGGTCDCAASQAQNKVANETSSVQQNVEQVVENVKETVEEVKNEAVQAAETVQESAAEKKETVEHTVSSNDNPTGGADIAKKVDGIAVDGSEDLPGSVKNSKNALYIAGCIIALIVLLLLMCVFGGGAKSAVKNYVKAKSNKKGGKTFYSYTLPKSVYKKLDKNDKLDDLIDSFNKNVKANIKNLEDKETMPKFARIVNKKKLDDSDLKSIEKYFKAMCKIYKADDSKIKVTKGYEMKVKTKKRDEDGDTDYQKQMIFVVKLKNDGWKIIAKDSVDTEAIDYFD